MNMGDWDNQAFFLATKMTFDPSLEINGGLDILFADGFTIDLKGFLAP